MGIANITNNILTDSGLIAGSANGIATLDSGGKIPASQLPNSVMEFKGVWDASVNNPSLANGTGNAGDVYEVSAAGTVNFGAGAISFSVGDYVLYDGSQWQFSSGQKGTITSLVFSAPLTGGTITTSGTVSISQASGSTDGYLSSTDWTTFNNKQSALTNPVTGTGTTNYVARWTSSSAIGIGVLYDNGTNVGIGTTSPSQKLHISGGNLLINNGTSPDANSGLRIVAPISSTHYNWMLAAQQNVADAFEITPSTAVGGTTFTSPKLVVLASGNVGICTTSPAAAGGTALAIYGGASQARLALKNSTTGDGSDDGLQIGVGTDGGAFLEQRENNYMILSTNAIERMRITSGGNLLLGTTTDGGFKLDVNGTTRVSGAATITGNLTVDTNTFFVDATNDKVGIGTTSPAYKLQVVTNAVSGRQNMSNISRTTGNWVRFTNPQFSVNASIGLLLRVFPDSDERQGAGIIASGGLNNACTDLDLFVTTSPDGSGGTSYSALNINGYTGAATFISSLTADDYRLSALNTAPATSSSTGTLGEIRIDANHIYVCTATNTWKRVAIATF